MSATDYHRDNERRVARMNTWIDHAEDSSRRNEDHIRFLFYWIAYEAAYQIEDSKVKDRQARESLHRKLAFRDTGKLQNILRDQQEDVVRIFELRQAHRFFWSKDSRWNARAWESEFQKRVESMTGRLLGAVHSGAKETLAKKGAIQKTLDDLFDNLSVVRNQIVHGASAGSDSRGRTQVILGAGLLSAFVPCFRKIIEANLNEDWGDPPFPRVGEERDEKCSPRWLY